LIGYQGAVVSSIVSHIVLITFNLVTLKKIYGFNYTRVRSRLFLMLLSTSAMIIVGYAFLLLGWHNIIIENRWITLLKLTVSGGVSLATYIGLSWVFGLPQMYILQRKKIHGSN